MKKLFLIGLSFCILALPAELKAQDDTDSKPTKAWKGVKKGVKKGAHEVAEQTVELKSDVEDRELDGKMGPDGQDIFVEDDNRYYYVDGKGHKVYLKASQLRDRPRKDDDD